MESSDLQKPPLSVYALVSAANLLNPLHEDYQAAVQLITRFPEQQITIFDAVTAVLAVQMIGVDNCL